MRNGRSSFATLLAIAAISGMAALPPVGAATSSTATRRPPVRRMPVSSSKKIQEWNAAVEAKRRAKKQRK